MLQLSWDAALLHTALAVLYAATKSIRKATKSSGKARKLALNIEDPISREEFGTNFTLPSSNNNETSAKLITMAAFLRSEALSGTLVTGMHSEIKSFSFWLKKFKKDELATNDTNKMHRQPQIEQLERKLAAYMDEYMTSQKFMEESMAKH